VSHGIDPEEAAALAVLDELGRLDRPEDTNVPEPEDEIDQALRRMHADALAMLAWALPPERPRPELRAAIFAATVGESTQEVEPLESDQGAAARPARRGGSGGSFAPVIPFASRPESNDPAADRSAAARAGHARRSVGGRRWLAVAACLALALVGAGFWIAWLQSELAAQSTRLAWAEREWKGRADEAMGELRRLESRLSLVTSPAATVFRLTCPGTNGPGTKANASVYVAADRRNWDLDIQGLEDEPPGHEYQLWFLVGDEAKSGGCFSIEDGEVVLLNPASFPEGTTGIAISLEPKGGSARPTAPPILVSDDRRRI
jgi:hypothetical protein